MEQSACEIAVIKNEVTTKLKTDIVKLACSNKTPNSITEYCIDFNRITEYIRHNKKYPRCLLDDNGCCGIFCESLEIAYVCNFENDVNILIDKAQTIFRRISSIIEATIQKHNIKKCADELCKTAINTLDFLCANYLMHNPNEHPNKLQGIKLVRDKLLDFGMKELKIDWVIIPQLD